MTVDLGNHPFVPDGHVKNFNELRRFSCISEALEAFRRV